MFDKDNYITETLRVLEDSYQTALADVKLTDSPAIKYAIYSHGLQIARAHPSPNAAAQLHLVIQIQNILNTLRYGSSLSIQTIAV